MPVDGDSNSLPHTRREFIGYTGPVVGLGAIGTDGLVGDRRIKNLLSNPQTAPPTEHNTVAEDIHRFPDDPFIVPAFGDRWFSLRSDLIGDWLAEDDVPYFLGWNPTPLSHQIRTVMGLHPDALDSHRLANYDDGRVLLPDPVTDILDFARQTGIPSAAGWNYTINLDRPLDRYGPIMEKEGWRYPDGTPLDNPRGLLSLTFDGQVRPIHGTRAIPSAFAPGVLDLLVRVTEERLQQGFSGFFVDGSGDVFLTGHGVDFSVWARAAFRDHLSALPEERLTELGIDDPATFNIRSYLETESLTPDSGADPRGDAIFREYVIHNHLGIKSFFENYRQAVTERFPDRMEQGRIKLWNNQFMGNFEAPQGPKIYTSDSFDIINTELYPTVQPGVGFKYKLLRAMGRFSKPVMAKGTLAPFGEPRIDAFDPTNQYRMLQRFLMAEAYANGAIFKPALTVTDIDHVEDAITHWIEADGTVPDELQSFIDFVWSHRRFLEPSVGESDVRCAVVWSLATRIWRYEPQWGLGSGGNTPLLDSFVGTVRLLREAQIPYDVIVFGHSRLWNDTDQLDRLHDYDVVVLPGVECLSKTQVAAIGEYLDANGSVVTSGEPPDRDEMYVPDGDVVDLFERADVTVLDDDPGQQRATKGRAGGSLVDALEDLDIEPVVTEINPSLAVHRRTQPAESRSVVHLLNYDYSPQADEFTPIEDVSLRIRKPDHAVSVARYFSPQRSIDLDFTSESNRIELVVPKLVEWGFIVLASSPDALVEASAESDARESIEQADRLVDEARDTDRDWGPDFALATTKLDSARTAMEFDAFAQAETAASDALEAISDTYPRPFIGVDLSHNQSTWQAPSWMGIDADVPFWWLQENFENYHFELVESWDPDVLESIDVLLCPPALESQVSSFGFESHELELVEQFVSNGGSIVIIGDWRAADGLGELTKRFGFEFLGPKIQFPEEEPWLAPTSSSHPLTRGIKSISLGNGTPIGRWPESAEILAAVPEESPAWLSTGPPHNERSGDERLAAGAAVFAHAKHGSGHVVLLGSPYFAFAPMHADPAMRLVYNLFTYLGRESVSKRSDPGSADSTSTPTQSVPTTDTPGQPGFGAMAAIAGIGATLSYLLYRDCPGED